MRAGLARPQLRTAADVMIRDPKTHPADVSIERVRVAFEDAHVHMVLLTHDGVLCGTLVRDDIANDVPGGRPALELAVLRNRTAEPDEYLSVICRDRMASAERRIAVVGRRNHLLGLICLKRDRSGFCTDADVRSCALERSQAGPEVAAAIPR